MDDFVLNLSAPFVTQAFSAQILHTDYLTGSKAEAETLVNPNATPGISNPTPLAIVLSRLPTAPAQPSLSAPAVLIMPRRRLSTFSGAKKPPIRMVPESAL